MSSRSWTAEQQKVIDTRGKNILVSASAGSGKTAVLVERILKRVMGNEQEEPVDIDKMLIVTFTNAAAAEMRERISKVLEEQAEKHPENVHLQRQLTLVHHAQITTIHSFCQYVIRNYFHLADLDPSFRIADEIENTLLRGEAIEELLEAKYEEKDKGFLQFVECYASGKKDTVLEEMILKAYEFSMSHPFPEEWLYSLSAPYECESSEAFNQLPLIQWMCGQVVEQAKELKALLRQAMEIVQESDGPYMYESAIESDLMIFSGLQDDMSYEGLYQMFSHVSYERLSAKKDESVSENKKNQVKVLREQVKKGIESISKNYFSEEEEAARIRMNECAAQVKVFADLILDFSERFALKKREKNIIDFHDLEHIALGILRKNKNPTNAARELRSHYEEIFIDEYQDSNLVQEYLLTSVAGGSEENPKNNLFMVGDVKQSIYRFRMARPELFMEKYDSFPIQDTDGKNIRIDLHKNFRSRGEVLEGANYIFYKIMQKSMGNVVYDEEAALQTGANYPEKPVSFATEWLFVEGDGDSEEIPELEEISGRELEARAVAREIKKLVQDEERNISYGDIVILLRSMTGWRDVFEEVLMMEGIPVAAGSSEGYFSAIEVQVVLAYLDIIDNPRQDIPLAVVLKSPIVGLSTEQLAKIKGNHKELSLYDAVLAEQEENETVRTFLLQLEDFRDRTSYTSIHELIEQVYEETGYYYFASAMPEGATRREHLDMLLQKAVDYEKTSYSGLFHFLRYIEKMKKYEIEFSQGAEETQEDKVRIMTIHKSKGLEFPYVFVSGMGKQFNKQDLKQSFLLDMDMGIGVEYRNPKVRVKTSTLYKRILQKKVDSDSLGEELRVLYVAFTRAKEKLYITGTVKKFLERLEKLPCSSGDSSKLSLLQLTTAQTYMDWFLPCLADHGAMKPLYEEMGIDRDVREWEPEYHIRYIAAKELQENQGEETIVKNAKITGIKGRAQLEAILEEEKTSELEEKFSYRYQYEKSIGLPAKVSVSELKKAAYEKALEEEAEAYEMFDKGVAEKYTEEPVETEMTGNCIDELAEQDANNYLQTEELLPEFLKNTKKELTGVERGNAYHHVMERMDFSLRKFGEIKEYIQILVENGTIRQAEADCVSVKKIKDFLNSNLANRMYIAQREGKLFLEQPFVYEIPAKRMSQDNDVDTLLIQGIIDGYFVENDEIVLMDYKTDYVHCKEDLIKRYEVQLGYYAEALESLTAMKVKEKRMYSFCLEEEILVS